MYIIGIKCLILQTESVQLTVIDKVQHIDELKDPPSKSEDSNSISYVFKEQNDTKSSTCNTPTVNR